MTGAGRKTQCRLYCFFTCHDESSLSARGTGWHDVCVAEEHPSVVEGHTHPPELRNEVDGAHWRGGGGWRAGALLQVHYVCTLRLHLVVEQ